MPSDEDTVRDHVVTAEEEHAYVTTVLSKFELMRNRKKTTHGPFPALHNIARIILDQGIRPDEVLNLRVGDVDFAKGTLRVTRGKTKAARRTLALTPTVKSILAAPVAGRTVGWVFVGKKPGSHLTKVNNPHDAVVKAIGAEFTLYEFRHTFATRFGEAVGDPLALAAILGHSSLKIVMDYCHTQESHTAGAMQKFIAARSAQTQNEENVAVN